MDEPLCVPFNSTPGGWEWSAGGGPSWVPSTPPRCRWLAPDLPAFSRCAVGRTLVFGGDSVVRYMVTTMGKLAWACEEEGGVAAGETAAARTEACNALFGLKEKKGDAAVRLPGAWGNVTIHFRYLRFGYEFLDRAAAWAPDHLGDPAAADFILLGGMGYWDARYRTHDVLYNVLERLGGDMEPFFERNPTLRDKLVVLSTTYSEPYDGRTGMFPHDILDAVNVASGPVWRGMGVRWFDVTRFVRAGAHLQGRLRGSGNKLLTIDGYHPLVEVQWTLLREVFSHACALFRGGARGEGVAPPPARATAAAAAAVGVVAAPARAPAEGGELRGVGAAQLAPIDVALLCFLLLCTVLPCCRRHARRLLRLGSPVKII
jgi:hypothetical protein